MRRPGSPGTHKDGRSWNLFAPSARSRRSHRELSIPAVAIFRPMRFFKRLMSICISSSFPWLETLVEPFVTPPAASNPVSQLTRILLFRLDRPKVTRRGERRSAEFTPHSYLVLELLAESVNLRGAHIPHYEHEAAPSDDADSTAMSSLGAPAPAPPTCAPQAPGWACVGTPLRHRPVPCASPFSRVRCFHPDLPLESRVTRL
jgi:hypothetical protein